MLSFRVHNIQIPNRIVGTGIKLYCFQHLKSDLAIFLADNMRSHESNKPRTQLTSVTSGLNKYFMLLHPCLHGNYCLCLHLLLIYTHLPTLVFNFPVHIHIQRKSVSRTKWMWKEKPADVTPRVYWKSVLLFFFLKLCSSSKPRHSSPAHSSQSQYSQLQC